MLDFFASISLFVAQTWASWQAGMSLTDNLWIVLWATVNFWKWLVIVTYVFWALFVFGMNVERERNRRLKAGDEFSWVQWLVCAPPVAILVIVDVAFRYTYGMVLFFPYFTGFFKDITLSNVMNTILSTQKLKDTWRYNLSKWIAKNLINPFSSNGQHIKLVLEPEYTPPKD